jgi:hypothetical protein
MSRWRASSDRTPGLRHDHRSRSRSPASQAWSARSSSVAPRKLRKRVLHGHDLRLDRNASSAARALLPGSSGATRTRRRLFDEDLVEHGAGPASASKAEDHHRPAARRRPRAGSRTARGGSCARALPVSSPTGGSHPRETIRRPWRPGRWIEPVLRRDLPRRVERRGNGRDTATRIARTSFRTATKAACRGGRLVSRLFAQGSGAAPRPRPDAATQRGARQAGLLRKLLLVRGSELFGSPLPDLVEASLSAIWRGVCRLQARYRGIPAPHDTSLRSLTFAPRDLVAPCSVTGSIGWDRPSNRRSGF